ncbi:MAG: chromate transporter [Kiritimatiellia bacterium]
MQALYLFWGFFKVGLLGFGGGPSMIPLMQAEVVGSGWMNDEQFLEGLAAGNALPGPISTKMAVYVGFGEYGYAGAISAILGVMTPSAVLMAVVGGLMMRFREHPVLTGALGGARAAVVGMLFFVAVSLAPGGIKDWAGLLIGLAAFAALMARVHPGLVMVGALILGILIYR